MKVLIAVFLCKETRDSVSVREGWVYLVAMSYQGTSYFYGLLLLVATYAVYTAL